MKKIIASYAAVAMLLSAVPVFAMPTHVAGELNTPGIQGKALSLPQVAIDNAEVISLGTAIDPQTGQVVEGIKIIHYKKGFGKGNAKGKPGGGDGGTVCYSFLANGAKWNTPEPYMVNGTNHQDIASVTIESLIDTAVASWENEVTADIFGPRVAFTGNGIIDETSPDGDNEVVFGSYPQNGVIAVTIVWGVFRGPPSSRGLVEWDMLFDEVDFGWSISGEANKMDFLNIAAHEMGHAAGMGHPASTCTEETMYAYADYGETKKQTLNTGDIAGIQALYQ